jgi:hypothetical protein
MVGEVCCVFGLSLESIVLLVLKGQIMVSAEICYGSLRTE